MSVVVDCASAGGGSTAASGGSGDTSFAGALLFAVHPVSGVPVNYLAGRDLLLMMLFLTASLLAYARMRRLRGDSQAGERTCSRSSGGALSPLP